MTTRRPLLAVALLLAAPARAAETAHPGHDGLEAVELEHGGRPRRAWLKAPPKLGKRRPIVLLLTGRQGIESLRKLTRRRFEELGLRDGALVVYPEPTYNIWNDGRGVKTFQSHMEKVDDVGYLRALVKRLAARHGGDRRRVYAVGWSNGALMSKRLACEPAFDVKGVAAVGGTLALNRASRCRPKGAPSLMTVTGDLDPYFSWKEGLVRIGPFEFGRIISPEKDLALWRELLGCGRLVRSTLPDADPDDGTTVRLSSARCRDGAALRFYAVKGGGHTWPGGEPWELPTLTGPGNGDFDAADAAWKLFFPR
ncbi:MAG: hypothetical protein HYZ75_02640 [Elusimicrobia bacterium]|nr:hypothetical protein [Elusimicrobiota bacterium]